MARPAYDHGEAEPQMPAEHMLLLLGRSQQRSASLETFLSSVQDSRSPEYHHFLSPTQFAAQYGPSDADLQTVTNWLQTQGFHVDKLGAGRQTVEFSGTAGQVKQAFHTALHKYVVATEEHYANATPPEIPGAFAPLVKGVLLGNFGAHAQVRHRGTARMDRSSRLARPLTNVPTQQYDCPLGYCFGVAPGDFAKIYNTAPLLTSGINGAGITIGIVGDAPLDLPSAQAYRQNFLPSYDATNLPTSVLEGPTPIYYGSSDDIEAQTDVEVAGGVAPNAKLIYYYGGNSYTSVGVNLALIRAIDDNQISILSVSFGGCEAYFGDTWDAFYNNLYQQAAAQGITVVVAAGDSGSANCDPPPNSLGVSQAVDGLAVSGMASTAYNVAVGGTDFYYPAHATLSTLSTYWNTVSSTSANNNPDWSSAKGYIPEKAWNVSDMSLNQVQRYPQLGSGGGGKSSCVVSTGATPNVCVSGYPQPSWQAGFTQDSVRDVPDVSLFASDTGNYSFTPVCLQGQCTLTSGGPNSTTSPLEVEEVGGTSVSAPAFAGILALVEQKVGSRLGQVNAVLYSLAKQQPSVFHDITAGTNRVQCLSGTPNCGTDGYLTGYSAGTGYDLATGLGSVDAAALANHWNDVVAQSTSTTLSITPSTAVHGTALTFTVNVTGGVTSGNIALLTTARSADLQGQYVTFCSTFPCTFTYAGMPGGSYNVAARFAGDATHAASTSANVPLTINPENSEVGIYYQVGSTSNNGLLTTVTDLNGQTFPFGTGQQFTAFPLPIEPLPVNPFLIPAPATGAITVLDNGIAIGSPLTLNAQGNATFSSATLPVGQHSLVASYSGDASYTPSTSATPLATPMNFTIVKAPTSLTLTPTSAAVPPGTSVTLTAVAWSYNSLAIDGSVSVQVTSASGALSLPDVPLAVSSLYGGPTATITVPASVLVAGANTVSVTWPGNSNLLAAPAATATIVVEQPNDSMTVVATPAAPTAGQKVTIRTTLNWQTIAGVSGASGYLNTTMDGAALCGTSFANFISNSIDNDCTIQSIQPGTHTITSVFPGDGAHTPTSATITLVVAGTPPPVSFGLKATAVTLPGKTSNPSGTSTLTLTLANAQASAMTFSLSCSTANAPAGLSCSVPSSLTVAAGSTQGTATGAISFSGTTAALHPAPGAQQPLVWFALLPAAWWLRRKRLRAVPLLCALLVMLSGLTACGSGGTPPGLGGGKSTPTGPLSPGTYAVTVTAKNSATTSDATILVYVP